MMHFARGILLVAVALAAIACSGGGSTPAPATPATSPGASAATGSGLTVVAKNLAYDTNALSAPGDTAFTIDFDNQDSAPHNIAIKDASGAGTFKGEIVTSTKIAYKVPALGAGSYTFLCEVHPNMTGTLTVH